VGLCQDCVLAVGIECANHPSRQAVALCRGCGKGICQDCYDHFCDNSGTALCYQCAVDAVKEHAAEGEKWKEMTKKERTWMIVGGIFGLLVGSVMGAGSGEVGGFLAGAFFGTAIGGSLGTILTAFFGIMASMGDSRSDEGAALGCAFSLIALAFMCAFAPIITIYRYVKRNNEIKTFEEIIAADNRTLQEMRDYFAYTQAMEQRPGINLATLAAQGSELYSNTYAQSVLKNGEQAAQAELRRGAIRIAENGEVIRGMRR